MKIELKVRVPTHDGGSCLFWEFATDYYDIGFGIFFEWYVLNTLEDQEGIATEQENVVHNEANDDYIELGYINSFVTINVVEMCDRIYSFRFL